MEGEVWKDIITIPYHQAEWPYHQVSNYGRVRALPGGRISQRIVTEIEVRKLAKTNGYVSIKQGRCNLYVHHLVLNAFVGPCPPGLECRHLNGDRSDNRWPENLIWGTWEENYEDRIRHGTDLRGERHPNSKFTQSEVDYIRSHQNSRGLIAKLAREFNVSWNAIRDIRTGRCWNNGVKQ
jgi:hypothetical protein